MSDVTIYRDGLSYTTEKLDESGNELRVNGQVNLTVTDLSGSGCSGLYLFDLQMGESEYGELMTYRVIRHCFAEFSRWEAIRFSMILMRMMLSKHCPEALMPSVGRDERFFRKASPLVEHLSGLMTLEEPNV